MTGTFKLGAYVKVVEREFNSELRKWCDEPPIEGKVFGQTSNEETEYIYVLDTKGNMHRCLLRDVRYIASDDVEFVEATPAPVVHEIRFPTDGDWN